MASATSSYATSLSLYFVWHTPSFSQTTYAYGARNFLVFNTPQVGCVPLLRNTTATGACPAAAAAAAQGLSAGLETLVGALRAQLPNSTFVLFDSFNATTAAIAYPATFGELPADFNHKSFGCQVFKVELESSGRVLGPRVGSGSVYEELRCYVPFCV